MAQQQWISPAYQPAPTFIARCVALKTGFNMVWKDSNRQTMPFKKKKKKIYISVRPIFTFEMHLVQVATH